MSDSPPDAVAAADAASGAEPICAPKKAERRPGGARASARRTTLGLGVTMERVGRQKRFKARIQIDRTKIFLGRFDTIDEAQLAYDLAARSLGKQRTNKRANRGYTNADVERRVHQVLRAHATPISPGSGDGRSESSTELLQLQESSRRVQLVAPALPPAATDLLAAAAGGIDAPALSPAAQQALADQLLGACADESGCVGTMLDEALEEGLVSDTGYLTAPGPLNAAATAALPSTSSEACWLQLHSLQCGSQEDDGMQLPVWGELQLLQPYTQLQLRPQQMQPQPPSPLQQQSTSNRAELLHPGGAPAAAAGALPCSMLLTQPAVPAAVPGTACAVTAAGESSAMSFAAACAMAASGMHAWVAAGTGACASADALAYLAWLKRRTAGPGTAEQAAYSFMGQVLLALLSPADGAIAPRAHALALLDGLCGALLALQAKLGASASTPADAVVQWLEELQGQPASADGEAVFELACMLHRSRTAW